MPDLIGGRYELRRQLGIPGLQGEVYEALDTHERDIVAIKLLNSRQPGGTWNEAQILRRLTDRHILPIRNADVAAGRPYLVTELATGGSLDRPLKDAGSCGLPVDDVVRWMRHACLGIARAHDLGLLHNDVKPQNLFVDDEDECLVGDFGLATSIPAGTTHTTIYGCTPETAAPEVSADPSGICASVASDIYSLGATAYWLIAGRPALDFAGITDFHAKLAHAANNVPGRLWDLAPQTPRSVQTIIETAMAPDPLDRYRKAVDLAAAFGRRPARRTRRWRRTDEHDDHMACFTGDSTGRMTSLTLCVTPDARPTQVQITTFHTLSGNRIHGACRSSPKRTWASAVRSAMRAAG